MAINFYPRLSLTGGVSGSLDNLDGDLLADTDIAMVGEGTDAKFYMLDDDSGAEESSPGIIAPDDNAGTKRWILLGGYAETYEAETSFTVGSTVISSEQILNTSDFAIKVSGSEMAISCSGDAGVSLFYNGSMRLETTATGFSLGDMTSVAATFGFSSDDLVIRNNDPGGKIIFHGELDILGPGDVDIMILNPEGAIELFWAGSVVARTHAGGISVVEGADSASLTLTSDDFKLQNHTDGGDLYLTVTDTTEDTGIKIAAGGPVELYYDNALKLSTTAAGISITDGSAVAATIGFDSDDLQIVNADPEGMINLMGEKSAIGSVSLFRGDPAGAVSLHYDGGFVRLSTTAAGISITDGSATAATIGFSSDDLYLSNNDADGEVYITAEKTGTGQSTLFHGDPDGAVELYWAGAKKFETTANGVIIGDGTATGFEIKYLADDIYIDQLDADGKVYFRGQNAADNNLNDMLIMDPDTGVALYHADVKALETISNGIYIYEAAKTAQLYFISDDFRIYNKEEAGHIILLGENTESAVTLMLDADPDAGVILKFEGADVFETVAGGSKTTGDHEATTSLTVGGTVITDNTITDDGVLVLNPATSVQITGSAGADLLIGTADTAFGSITCYGDGGSSTSGGAILFYTATDHDGSPNNIQMFGLNIIEDDLWIGPDIDWDSLIYTGVDDMWSFTGTGVDVVNALTANTVDADTDFTVGGTVITDHTITDDGTLELIATTSVTLTANAVTTGSFAETDVITGDVAGGTCIIHIDVANTAIFMGDVDSSDQILIVDSGNDRIFLGDDNNSDTYINVDMNAALITLKSTTVDIDAACTATTFAADTNFTVDGLVLTADTITNDAALNIISSGVVSHNQDFTIGSSGVNKGILYLEGSASGIGGGELWVATGDDHDDTGILSYHFKVVSDDLEIGPNSLTDALKFIGSGVDTTPWGEWEFNAPVQIPNGILGVGAEDSQYGVLALYGDGGSSTSGGASIYYTAADHDDPINYFQINVIEDDFWFGSSVDADMLVFTASASINATVPFIGTTIDASTDFTVGGTVITNNTITDDGTLIINGVTAVQIQENSHEVFETLANGGVFGGAEAAGGEGRLDIGKNDIANGRLILYGDNDDEGGYIQIYCPANHDDAVSVWEIRVNQDDFRIGPTTDTDAFQITSVGAGAVTAAFNVALTVTDLISGDAGKHEWDSLPVADDTCSGDISSEDVDTNGVGIGALLVLAADGSWDEADADAAATCGLLGIAVEAGTGAKQVMHQGWIHSASHGFTVGAQLFVSLTQGTMTNTAPSGSGEIVQVVGYATSADVIRFNPSSDYMEIT